MKEKNFTVVLENDESPVLITVPHGGMSNMYGSWLETFFQKRIKSENLSDNYIKGEKVVTGGDGQILHVASDILKSCNVNAVIGLLPRAFVDYNRFVPEVAYTDEKIKPFYNAYHNGIKRIINNLLKKHKCVYLFDLHGFAKQPLEKIDFDVILGTNGESSPKGLDKKFYYFLKNKNYNVFCANVDGLPSECMYKGDTTNLHYFKKFKNVESILVEISPFFRGKKVLNSKENGEKIAKDIADFFKIIEI